ncbi:transcription factor grauzone-like [Armigeres subalbatus]|uniref:transcription factor grauzone-like n=1 Tax=Armigeres subalbatus TaxID=124917 RepID=UPI002ED31113
MDNACNFCFCKNRSVVELQQNGSRQNPPMQCIAAKHFWFTNEELECFYICELCRNKLLEFHQFYCQVENLYAADPELDQIKLECVSIETDTDHGENEDVDEKTESETTQNEETIHESETTSNKNVHRLTQSKLSRRRKRVTYSKDQFPTFDHITDEDIRIFCRMECHVCAEQFDHYGNLKNHCVSAHNQHGCYVNCCGCRFTSLQRLQEHIIVHLDPTYFRCKHCTKIMSSRRSLIRHYHSVHLSEEGKKFSCDMCPKKFGKQFLLNDHIKCAHDHNKCDPTYFRCKHCTKIMSSRRSLTRHYHNAHLSEEGKKFNCDKCPKKFGKRFLLNDHIKCAHGARNSNSVNKGK